MNYIDSFFSQFNNSHILEPLYPVYLNLVAKSQITILLLGLLFGRQETRVSGSTV